ncbi:MAG: 23S rRNA pseudouridine1911/1915/1917 synthase [Candidatus Endobugula sp.]|jgi:23S rRNA pseudouridine1911/1915/1917 synthase
MTTSIQQQHIVPDNDAGKRVDQVATRLFEQYSRSRIQEWIKQESILVDGCSCRVKDKLIGGESITLNAELVEVDRWVAQDIPVNEVYSDDHIIIINKPAGLVVHPGAGMPDSTLLNGLLFHYPELSTLPRAGIVHRLDKDTTGLMVIARSLLAHTSLVQQLQDRSLGREYEAVAMGELTGGGVIDKPMGRHPTQRIKMAVIDGQSRYKSGSAQTAKEAVTHYRLLKRFKGYTHIACQLETGRTHQIRVHLSHIKHPLVGDPVYLTRQKWVAGTEPELKAILADFSRQALHARRLTLVHPESGDTLEWESELPSDMQQLLLSLAEYA